MIPGYYNLTGSFIHCFFANVMTSYEPRSFLAAGSTVMFLRGQELTQSDNSLAVLAEDCNDNHVIIIIETSVRGRTIYWCESCTVADKPNFQDVKRKAGPSVVTS